MPAQANHRKTARGEASRRRILDAAIALICERGYSGTSVDAVCKRAKVVKTALYWHFGSKAGLLAAIIHEITEQWVDDLELQAGEGANPIERLDAMLAGFRVMITSRQHSLQIVAAIVAEPANIAEEVMDAVRWLNEHGLSTIAKGFEESIGVPVPTARLLAHTITSMMHGIHRQHVVQPGGVDLDAYFYDMKRTILVSVEERFKRNAGQLAETEGVEHRRADRPAGDVAPD
jgi:AcrR family transcriptional regulator